MSTAPAMAEIREHGRKAITRILDNDAFTRDEKVDGIVTTLESAMTRFLDVIVPEQVAATIASANIDVIVGDGMREIIERGRGMETILAFLIDNNYNGRLVIDQASFDRWVDSHPHGGHVEDVGGETVMDLVVHHGPFGQREN